MINGSISKSCLMEKGIRQGCSISALLFMFVVETLAKQIKNNNDIDFHSKKKTVSKLFNMQITALAC